MDRLQLLKSDWDKCQIDQNPEIERAAQGVLSGWLTYKAVGDQLFIPPWVIGILHYRESNFDFGTWLANGDPLYSADGKPIPTTHVPAGLGPASGWADGAMASLIHQGWGAGNLHWDISNALDNIERFNGLGYQEMGVPSPYLWSMTNVYKKGKYSADGAYDPEMIDRQAGCAAIMKALESMGVELEPQQTKGEK